MQDTRVMKFANTELQTYKRCKRKWWLAFYRSLRLRREGVGPLSIGNMIHAPLEAYYATPDRDPATFDWKRVLDAHYQERLQHPEFLKNGHSPEDRS